MNDRVEILVPGRFRYLGLLRSFFCALLDEHQEVALGAQEVASLQLVLQEACVNAIRHGNQGRGNEPLKVSFVVRPESLTIEVCDRGSGFDPEAVSAPDVEGLQEGGYGVFIMKQSVDRVVAKNSGDGFVLSLTKVFRRDTAKAGERP